MFTKNADAHKSFLKTKHNFGAYELVKKKKPSSDIPAAVDKKRSN